MTLRVSMTNAVYVTILTMIVIMIIATVGAIVRSAPMVQNVSPTINGKPPV